MNDKTTVSYDSTSWKLSAAYLSMWSALKSYDPEGDTWSEPVDIGSRDDRARTAELRVTQAKTIYEPSGDPTQPEIVDDQLTEFHDQFAAIVRSLRSGAEYSSEMRAFASRLRDRGATLADESVHFVSSAESSQ